MESSNTLILTFGALSLGMLLIGILLLFCVVKVIRILNEMNTRMQIAETKFEEIQGKLKDFTEDIGPFFFRRQGAYRRYHEVKTRS